MQTLEWPLTDIYCNFSHENLFCSLQVLMDVCMTMKVIEGHFSEGADFFAKSGAKGIIVNMCLRRTFRGTCIKFW